MNEAIEFLKKNEPKVAREMTATDIARINGYLDALLMLVEEQIERLSAEERILGKRIEKIK